MRLIRLHVENFGKLSDYDLDFQEGLNTVLQENGWGKSTLAAFLRAMFYGLDGERKRGFSENERLRYAPWNKGSFGGSIEFECRGKRYLATRNFGQKEKDCTFKLQDAVTLLESNDFSEKLGEELFGIDRDSFGRTSFLDGDSLRYAGINSAIGSKVGAISQTDDLNNYDMAMETIKNFLNSHSPKLKKGALYQLNEEIYQLERNLEGAEALEIRANGIREKREREKDQLKSIKEKQEALQAELREISDGKLKALNLKRLKELEAHAKERGSAVSDLREEFQGQIPTADDLKELEEKLGEAEQQRLRFAGFAESGSSDRYDRLRHYFRNGVPRQEEITEQIEHCNELQKLIREREILEDQRRRQKQRLEELDLETKRLEAASALASAEKKRREQRSALFGILFLAVGVFLTIAGFVLKWKIFAWLGALACGLMGAGFLLRKKVGSMAKEGVPMGEEQVLGRQKEDCREELERLRTELENNEKDFEGLELQISDFLGRMEISYSRADAESLLYEMKNRAVEYAEMQREKQESEMQRAELSEKAQRSNEELEKLLVQMNIPLRASDAEKLKSWIADGTQRLMSYEAAIEEEKKAQDLLEAFRREHGELEGCTEELTEEALQAKEEGISAAQLEISGEVSRIHESISNYNRELEDILEKLEEIAQQRETLEALKETQDEETAKYQLVLKTQEYLQEAKEQFSARFMNPVKNAFDKYYRIMTKTELTDGGQMEDLKDNSEFQIDANMNIFRKEEGEYRDVQAQSTGYADMIGLCIRMALLDAMYREEKPLVIMDDPFAELDPNNLKGAKLFLQEISKNYQILYLTCHPNRT